MGGWEAQRDVSELSKVRLLAGARRRTHTHTRTRWRINSASAKTCTRQHRPEKKCTQFAIPYLKGQKRCRCFYSAQEHKHIFYQCWPEKKKKKKPHWNEHIYVYWLQGVHYIWFQLVQFSSGKTRLPFWAFLGKVL